MTVVASPEMLELITKRLNEMLTDNDIQQRMKGKYMKVKTVQILSTFSQGNLDLWSCYDHQQDGDETDIDCGGSCVNGCTMLQKCNTQADCVDGLFCTKKKCIDRSRKHEHEHEHEHNFLK